MTNPDPLQPTGSFNGSAVGGAMLAAGDEQIVRWLDLAAKRYGALEGYSAAEAVDLALAHVAGMLGLPPEHLAVLEKLWGTTTRT